MVRIVLVLTACLGLHAEQRGLTRRRVSPNYWPNGRSVLVAFIDADRVLEKMDETHTTIPRNMIEEIQMLNRMGYFVALVSRKAPGPGNSREREPDHRKELDLRFHRLVSALSQENAVVHYFDYLVPGANDESLAKNLEIQLKERFIDYGVQKIDPSSLILGSDSFRHFADQTGIHFTAIDERFGWPCRVRAAAIAR